MKKLSLIIAAIGAVAGGASAQTTLYNNLAGAGDDAYLDLDGGGSGNASKSYGSQIGQVITDASGVTSITSIESIFIETGTASKSGMFGGTTKTGVYAEVFAMSGSTVGSLVASQQLTGAAFQAAGSESDGTFAGSDTDGGYTSFDVKVNFTGLTGLSGVAGTKYLVVMQAESPTFFYAGVSYSSSAGVYVRDFSLLGYNSNPEWNTTAWLSASADGYTNANALMKVNGGGSTPEPASFAALGLGLVAVLRRRRR